MKKNIKILAISIDAGGAKDVKPFLTASHYTMPVLLDAEMEVLAQYGLLGTPGTFVADPQGILVAKGLGPVDFDTPAFRKYVLTLAEVGNGRG